MQDHRTYKKAKDGYRWTLSQWGDAFIATPQQRCTSDSGSVYYEFRQPQAEFNSRQDRQKFIANFTAKFWHQS